MFIGEILIDWLSVVLFVIDFLEGIWIVFLFLCVVILDLIIWFLEFFFLLDFIFLILDRISLMDVVVIVLWDIIVGEGFVGVDVVIDMWFMLGVKFLIFLMVLRLGVIDFFIFIIEVLVCWFVVILFEGLVEIWWLDVFIIEIGLFIFFVFCFFSFVIFVWIVLVLRFINVVLVGLVFFLSCVLLVFFMVSLFFIILFVFGVCVLLFWIEVLVVVWICDLGNWLKWLCCILFFLWVISRCKFFICLFVWGESFDIEVGCVMGFVLMLKVVFLLCDILLVCFILFLVFEFLLGGVCVREVVFV